MSSAALKPKATAQSSMLVRPSRVRRSPSGILSAWAFWRTAPGVRFNALDTSTTEVLAIECSLRAAISAGVHARRITRSFFAKFSTGASVPGGAKGAAAVAVIINSWVFRQRSPDGGWHANCEKIAPRRMVDDGNLILFRLKNVGYWRLTSLRFLRATIARCSKPPSR